MPHGEHDLEEAFARAFEDEGIHMPEALGRALAVGLVKAVEYATERASETLDIVGRRKLVRMTAVITAVIVSATLLPSVYFLDKSGRQRNCHLITKIAGVQRDRLREQGPEAERFKRESKDRFGLTQKRFDELIAEGEAREAIQLGIYEEVAHASC